MSLQINAHGTREGALKQVAAEPKDLPPGTDKAQLDAVRALIVSEVNALPDKFNGVRIQAEGNAHGNGRTIQLTVIALELHL